MAKILEISFTSEVIYWRGPSPYHFLKLPSKQAETVVRIAKQISYGWGVIPADVNIEGFGFYTALIPKDGSYLVPLKKMVREKLEIELGDFVKAEARFTSRS